MKSQPFTFSVGDASWREHTASQADADIQPSTTFSTASTGSMLMQPHRESPPLEPSSLGDQDSPMAGPSSMAIVRHAAPNPRSRPAPDDDSITGLNPKRVAVPGPGRENFDEMRRKATERAAQIHHQDEQLRAIRNQREDEIKHRDEEIKRRDEEIQRLLKEREESERRNEEIQRLKEREDYEHRDEEIQRLLKEHEEYESLVEQNRHMEAQMTEQVLQYERQVNQLDVDNRRMAQVIEQGKHQMLELTKRCEELSGTVNAILAEREREKATHEQEVLTLRQRQSAVAGKGRAQPDFPSLTPTTPTPRPTSRYQLVCGSRPKVGVVPLRPSGRAGSVPILPRSDDRPVQAGAQATPSSSRIPPAASSSPHTPPTASSSPQTPPTASSSSQTPPTASSSSRAPFSPSLSPLPELDLDLPMDDPSSPIPLSPIIPSWINSPITSNPPSGIPTSLLSTPATQQNLGTTASSNSGRQPPPATPATPLSSRARRPASLPTSRHPYARPTHRTPTATGSSAPFNPPNLADLNTGLENQALKTVIKQVIDQLRADVSVTSKPKGRKTSTRTQNQQSIHQQKLKMPKEHDLAWKEVVRIRWKNVFQVSSIADFAEYEPAPSVAVAAFETGKEGPDSNNVLDFGSSFERSRWNRVILKRLVDDLLEEREEDGTWTVCDVSNEYLMALFYGQLKRSREAWKKVQKRPNMEEGRLETGDEVLQRVEEQSALRLAVVASRSRRERKFERREKAVTRVIQIKTSESHPDLDTWCYFRELLLKLGVDGMSSEEEGTTKIDDVHVPVFYVKLCIWRAPVITDYLKSIDKESQNTAIRPTRGSKCHPRMYTDDPGSTLAPKGLPSCLYDTDWLRAEEDAKGKEWIEEELEVSKEVFELLQFTA
ncbi:hypothetical protein CPC08DRAFT_769319 [Agrocybe pediades]|nr:hypothetical protein CPC08DRAFT_769319 [Agrocybe pediades]